MNDEGNLQLDRPPAAQQRAAADRRVRATTVVSRGDCAARLPPPTPCGIPEERGTTESVHFLRNKYTGVGFIVANCSLLAYCFFSLFLTFSLFLMVR